jgi:hypothetical protein
MDPPVADFGRQGGDGAHRAPMMSPARSAAGERQRAPYRAAMITLSDSGAHVDYRVKDEEIALSPS